MPHPEARRQRDIYAFGDNTPGRKRIKPGDWICFYANGKGVVAHAKAESCPEHKPHKAVHDSARYPWVFRVSNTALYPDKPVVIDRDLRARPGARIRSAEWNGSGVLLGSLRPVCSPTIPACRYPLQPYLFESLETQSERVIASSASDQVLKMPKRFASWSLKLA